MGVNSSGSNAAVDPEGTAQTVSTGSPSSTVRGPIISRDGDILPKTCIGLSKNIHHSGHGSDGRACVSFSRLASSAVENSKLHDDGRRRSHCAASVWLTKVPIQFWYIAAILSSAMMVRRALSCRSFFVVIEGGAKVGVLDGGVRVVMVVVKVQR